MNGIIIEGKVYEAIKDKRDSCQMCDLNDNTGYRCICSDFCFELGRCNIFCFSQELTDKINKNE